VREKNVPCVHFFHVGQDAPSKEHIEEAVFHDQIEPVVGEKA
jgi:hypothetical protein